MFLLLWLMSCTCIEVRRAQRSRCCFGTYYFDWVFLIVQSRYALSLQAPRSRMTRRGESTLVSSLARPGAFRHYPWATGGANATN